MNVKNQHQIVPNYLTISIIRQLDAGADVAVNYNHAVRYRCPSARRAIYGPAQLANLR